MPVVYWQMAKAAMPREGSPLLVSALMSAVAGSVPPATGFTHAWYVSLVVPGMAVYFSTTRYVVPQSSSVL